jgi:hypothetical protein
LTGSPNALKKDVEFGDHVFGSPPSLIALAETAAHTRRGTRIILLHGAGSF